MTSEHLKELLREVDEIRFDNTVVALAEIRSVLSAVVDHLIFRQMDEERRR